MATRGVSNKPKVTNVTVNIVDQKTTRDIFMSLFGLVNIIPTKTQEIMVVETVDDWVRLYWNPLSKIWNVNRHGKDGWSPKGSEMSSKKILEMMDESEWKFYVENAKGLQYRTIEGVNVYRVDPPQVKTAML